MARQLPVLDGGLGENPSPIPPSIRTALQTYADKKHYAPVESGVAQTRGHERRVYKIRSAYYTLMDFEHYASKLKQHNIQTSDDLCVELAEKKGLITVSGTRHLGFRSPIC
jgi:aspartate/methionine/tyrosine aminotransferase